MALLLLFFLLILDPPSSKPLFCSAAVDGFKRQGSTSLVLRAEAREALMPGHDTLNLRQALDPVVHDLDRALEREIAVALLGGPQVFTFESLGAFASHVRVQRRICRAAARTAVAVKALAPPASHTHLTPPSNSSA